MNSFFLLTNLLQKPVYELNISLIKREISLANKIYIIRCAPKFRSYCSINPFGAFSICHICKKRSKNIVSDTGAIGINIDPNAENNKDLDLSTLKKIRNGVMSCLATHIRITKFTEINEEWRSVYKNIFYTSINLYHQLSNIDINGNLFIFNGRFDWGRTAREYCKNNNVDYIVFDQKWSHTFFSFKNSSIHSAIKNVELCESFYQSSDLRDFNAVTADFFNKRALGIPLYGKNYALNFSNDIKQKYDIVIFPSSADEYIFTDDFDENAKFLDQADEISNFISNLNNDYYQIAIRLHPNMGYMSKQYLDKFYALENKYSVKVYKPTDQVNSYLLFKNSKYTIFFASTIGFEAAYSGVNAIQIGPSFFSKMKITDIVSSGRDAAILINNHAVKLPNRKQAMKWAYYIMKYTEPLPGFKQLGNGIYAIDGIEIKLNILYKLVFLIGKFRIEISKGGFSEILNRRKYIIKKIINIISDRNAV